MTPFADWPVFLGLTVFLFGAAAWLTGEAIAATWRPVWQVLVYGAMLAAFDRFLHYGLFDGALLSATGFARDLAVIWAVGLASFRLARVRLIVRQYPWLYERAGPFRYRARRAG